MKLNLLPTYVSKEKQGRFAVVGAFLLAVVGLAGMMFMIRTSREAVQREQDRINAAKPDADRAAATSKQADQVMDQAKGLILNMNLAEAMNSHSKVYPELYDEVRQYIPGFFRISSLAAAANGPDSVTVTMTGYLKTFQEYADLMVALLKIPGAVAVSRSGFQLNDPMVPNLVPEDQTARPIRPNEPHIPDNPLDRLDLQIAQASITGFQNAGNFGSNDFPMVRGAMPNQSTVTVAVVIAGKNIQTPDPRATLAGAAALWGGSPTIPEAGQPAAGQVNPGGNQARPGPPAAATAGAGNVPANAPVNNRKNPAGRGDDDE
jgi:hypothetical protein